MIKTLKTIRTIMLLGMSRELKLGFTAMASVPHSWIMLTNVEVLEIGLDFSRPPVIGSVFSCILSSLDSVLSQCQTL